MRIVSCLQFVGDVLNPEGMQQRQHWTSRPSGAEAGGGGLLRRRQPHMLPVTDVALDLGQDPVSSLVLCCARSLSPTWCPRPKLGS